MTDDLRALIAAAIERAAHLCDGTDCQPTERECEDAYPVRRPEPWRHHVRVEGTPDGIAEAVLAVAQPIADERDQLAADPAIADEHIARGNEGTNNAYAQLRSALADRNERAENIACRIRAELVCCNLYARVNDIRELTFEQAVNSRAWHDLCYWGEASARIAEGRCPGYETSPNICRCPAAVINHAYEGTPGAGQRCHAEAFGETCGAPWEQHEMRREQQ